MTQPPAIPDETVPEEAKPFLKLIARVLKRVVVQAPEVAPTPDPELDEKSA